ncbi:MAG: polyphosphate kinase [Pseudomonas sp.]
MAQYSLSKKEFEQEEAELTEALLDAQYDLRKSIKGPVLVLISGNDAAGKAEVLYRFYEWLDNRFLVTRAFAMPEGVEQQMPHLWRYWVSLPDPDKLGFYLGSWYHQPQMRLVRGEITSEEFEQQMQEIKRFEQLLVNEGVALLKLWLQVPPGAGATDALQNVAMREWGDFSLADHVRLEHVTRQMTALTSTAEAPWIRVPSVDPGYRDIQVGRLVLEQIHALRDKRARQSAMPAMEPAPLTVLQQVDYRLKLGKDEYAVQLEHYQKELRALMRQPAFAGRSLLLVFEGLDAAGKGGTIRRITQCLDPRYLRVHGTRAPTPEERQQPYLLRFWRRVPTPGRVAIFDRSYYGRVLVERVEQLTPDTRWQQAYAEINDFESQLQAAGTVVVKFWLAITRDEQLERFKERDKSPLKRYKLTDEDWRNRERWPLYEQALNDMVAHTSTPEAPWHIVPSENKRYARVEVLKILCERLREALQ